MSRASRGVPAAALIDHESLAKVVEETIREVLDKIVHPKIQELERGLTALANGLREVMNRVKELDQRLAVVENAVRSSQQQLLTTAISATIDGVLSHMGTKLVDTVSAEVSRRLDAVIDRFALKLSHEIAKTVSSALAERIDVALGGVSTDVQSVRVQLDELGKRLEDLSRKLEATESHRVEVDLSGVERAIKDLGRELKSLQEALSRIDSRLRKVEEEVGRYAEAKEVHSLVSGIKEAKKSLENEEVGHWG